jgi:urease accessory protein
LFADISRSEPLPKPVKTPALERARGRVDLAFRASARDSVLARLTHAGALKVKLPRVAVGAPPEAVLINTAGGLAGGDRFDIAVTAGEGAAVTVTTAACEKVYRSTGESAVVDTALAVDAGGRLEWLPQETILFDRARYERRLTITMAADAAVLAVEPVVFGRLARGETLAAGLFRDQWRVSRDGRPLFADGTRLEGPIAAILDRPATLAGGRAVATLFYAAPDAEERLESVRAALAGAPAEAGASARDRMLIARVAAADGAALRATLIPALSALRGGKPMPKVWGC